MYNDQIYPDIATEALCQEKCLTNCDGYKYDTITKYCNLKLNGITSELNGITSEFNGITSDKISEFVITPNINTGTKTRLDTFTNMGDSYRDGFSTMTDSGIFAWLKGLFSGNSVSTPPPAQHQFNANNNSYTYDNIQASAPEYGGCSSKYTNTNTNTNSDKNPNMDQYVVLEVLQYGGNKNNQPTYNNYQRPTNFARGDKSIMNPNATRVAPQTMEDSALQSKVDYWNQNAANMVIINTGSEEHWDEY